MKTEVFSQKGLDELLGVNSGPKNDVSNSQSVSNHPATTQDSDLTTHPALTNNFSDLSQLGGPAQLPNAVTPTTTQQNDPSSQLNDEVEISNFHKMGTQMFSSGIQNPVGKIATPSSYQSPSSGSNNPLDPLASSLIQLILNNGQISQSFCSSLVDHLCQNAQFMTQLRGMLLQKLLAESKL